MWKEDITKAQVTRPRLPIAKPLPIYQPAIKPS